MKRQRRHQGRKRKRDAFTLIELLTACIITVLILTLTLQVFSATTDLWRHSEKRSDTFREARAALDIMVRDLRMTIPAAGTPMLKIGYEREEEERAYEEIYALAALPNSGKGTLCGIGYRCVWDEEARCYLLKRFFRSSDRVLADFKEAGDAPHFSQVHEQTNAIEEEAARYIWDLTFRPCENGAVAEAYPNRTYSDTLPLWIEIRFKALGPAAAKRLEVLPVTRETWNNPSDPLYTRHILPYQQQLSMRVRLYSANAE